MNKNEIITDMCMTYRHDYGLTRRPEDPPWVAGMTDEERLGLYKTMEQLYDHHIAPMQAQLEKLNNGDAVVLPKDVEHAEAMVKVGMFYLEQKNGKSSRIL